MALPIAHATAAYLIHRLDRRQTTFAGWRRALAFMTIANLPDADFLIGFAIGAPGTFHRGVSHTLVAALVFGAGFGALTRWRHGDRWLPASAVFACVYASHLLVDAFTIDARGPAGAQFLWPLSDAYYIAPVTLFSEIIVDGTSRLGFLRSLLVWPAVGVLARDALMAAVVIGAITAIENRLVARRANEEARSALTGAVGEEDLA